MRHSRRLIGHIGFEPQTGRTNGISDRQQRFFASQCASLGLARPLLLLRLRFLMLLLPREQELCLVALRGCIAVGQPKNQRPNEKTYGYRSIRHSLARGKALCQSGTKHAQISRINTFRQQCLASRIVPGVTYNEKEGGEDRVSTEVRRRNRAGSPTSVWLPPER